MKVIKILAVTLVLLSPTSASADDQKGKTAYDKGDFAAALREWTPLAEQGYAHAQHNLGYMYDKGEGVPQDYKTALKWYTLAAEQGHAKAQVNLGVMYYLGKGVPQDYKTALKWYTLAAEQGYAHAQRNLGVMYRIGRGVPQDEKTAVKWLILAAEQGIASAEDQLRLLMNDNQELRIELEHKMDELEKKRVEQKAAADDRAYQENPAGALRKYYLIDYEKEKQGAALLGMLSGAQATTSGKLDDLVRAEADQYALTTIAGGMEERMSEFLDIRSKNPDWNFDDVLYESGINIESIFYSRPLIEVHNKNYRNVFRYLYEQKDGPSFLVDFKRDLQKRMANCMDEQKKLPPSKRVSKDPDSVVAYCKNSVISARDADESLIIRRNIDSPTDNSIFEDLMKED